MAEKEYVLGNKAKDLYQYTRQVTKPGADDKVDTRDVAAVMRKMATAGTLEEMRNMLTATAERLEHKRSRPYFPKSESFGMIKDLRDAARAILRGVFAANETRFNDHPEDRLREQMRDYFQKRKGHDETQRRAAGLPYRQRDQWDYADGWILKADVHHFFASIDHDILKEKLRRRVVDDQVFALMCTYIDSTEGLPLGYQTSQLLALMYLDEFDHWIKETLHARYYGRYMDDFYIIHEDKEYLKKCLRLIREKMDGLKLELNGKTAIFPLKNGIDFLGFHTYLDSGGGVIMKLRRDSIDRMKARIRA